MNPQNTEHSTLFETLWAILGELRQTPTHLCYTCSPTPDSLDLIQRLAHEMVDRWLNWFDEAESVSEDHRPALAQRDLQMRRISAERDPGNQMAVKLLGSDLTNTLVRGLWGGLREFTQLP